MRYLLGLIVLAALVAFPQGVDAQVEEDPPGPQEPALKLEVDARGLETGPGDAPTINGYTLPEMENRVHNARVGVVMFGVVGVIGAGILIAGATYTPSETELDFTEIKYFAAGGSLLAVGAIGVAAMGATLGSRRQDLRELEAAQPRQARRLRWDVARARLVF